MTDPFRFEALTFPEDGSVLDAVDFSIAACERVAVFGPNGAGKSTLLRTIAGTAGNRRRRTGIAYLPQSPYMFRGSGRTNLLLGRDEPGPAMSLARRLGVESLLDEPAQSLSGGEAQRIAMARVLAGDEPIVLLDEPLAPIDGVDRTEVVSIIREATEGRALVCVSHSVDNAAAIAETLVVMQGGRIVQRGSVAEVLAEPNSETVARLVGIANVIEGAVEAFDGTMARVRIGTASVAVPLRADLGTTVVLRIPAETIAIFSEPPRGTSHRTVVQGTVRRILPRGSVVEVVMAGEPELVALATAGALDALGMSEGSDVWFGLKATAVDVVRVG